MPLIPGRQDLGATNTNEDQLLSFSGWQGRSILTHRATRVGNNGSSSPPRFTLPVLDLPLR